MDANPEVKEKMETLSTFLSKIATAKAVGQTFIETSEDVIKHFCPQGTGDAGYFLYKDIRVFKNGTSGDVFQKEKVQLGQILHGKEECIIEGR